MKKEERNEIKSEKKENVSVRIKERKLCRRRRKRAQAAKTEKMKRK